jgi:hypothetical protein
MLGESTFEQVLGIVLALQPDSGRDEEEVVRWPR